MGVVIELVALPLPEGRRVAPQIHGDVEDATGGAAHELRLPRLGLEVQAAQRVLDRARVVLLDEAVLDAELAPELLAVGLDQEAAVVPEAVGLDQDQAV